MNSKTDTFDFCVVKDADDYVDALPLPVDNKYKKPRASVSAEAFGIWNQKSAFKAKVIEKSQEAKDTIREKLNLAFMFSALDESEKTIVIDAMEIYNAPAT
jgi:cAMP-dependent protein kinase regulator